jgi:hypothetical protein
MKLTAAIRVHMLGMQMTPLPMTTDDDNCDVYDYVKNSCNFKWGVTSPLSHMYTLKHKHTHTHTHTHTHAHTHTNVWVWVWVFYSSIPTLPIITRLLAHNHCSPRSYHFWQRSQNQAEHRPSSRRPGDYIIWIFRKDKGRDTRKIDGRHCIVILSLPRQRLDIQPVVWLKRFFFVRPYLSNEAQMVRFRIGQRVTGDCLPSNQPLVHWCQCSLLSGLSPLNSLVQCICD